MKKLNNEILYERILKDDLEEVGSRSVCFKQRDYDYIVIINMLRISLSINIIIAEVKRTQF